MNVTTITPAAEEKRRSFVIYALLDPRTKEIRYVGKTEQNPPQLRVNKHIRAARNGSGYHCHRWIKTLLDIGMLPVLEILESGYGTKKEWEVAERGAISRIRIINKLTNHTSGGDSVDLNGPMGDVSRAKMSEATKKMWASPEMREHLCSAFRKRTVSKEARELTSKRSKGRRMSEEAKRKIGDATRLRMASQAAREVTRQSNRNREISEETRRKHSEHFKVYFSDPKARAAVGARRRGSVASVESRTKMSVSQRARNAKEREELVKDTLLLPFVL